MRERWLAKHAPATAKIDTNWIEAAMADFDGVGRDGHADGGMHDPLGHGAASPFELRNGHKGTTVRRA